jgi:hypothetical protein
MAEDDLPGAVDDTGATGSEGDAEGVRVTPVAIAVTALVLVAVAVAGMHLTLPAVVASQAPPDGHYPGPCWACHNVSQEAR